MFSDVTLRSSVNNEIPVMDFSHLNVTAAEHQLHQFVEDGEVEGVRALLKQRSDINVDAVRINVAPPATPLMIAISKEWGGEIAQLLIDAGADIEYEDSWKQRPAMKAVLYGQLENLMLLQQAGADISAESDSGRSAISYLDLYHVRASEILPHLLNAGCDPNEPWVGSVVQDSEAESMLFEVNQNKALPLLQLLLEAGADPLVQNEVGDTPTAIAQATGHAAAGELLQRYANLPRFAADKQYSAEELLRERNGGNRLLDNPHNWRQLKADAQAWTQEEDLPDYEMLLARDAEGHTVAEAAFAARCGDVVMQWLDAKGQHISTADLYDNREPTPLLKTLCSTGQAVELLKPERVDHYSTAVVRDIHRRLPQEFKSRVPLHAIVQKKQMESQLEMGVGWR